MPAVVGQRAKYIDMQACDRPSPLHGGLHGPGATDGRPARPLMRPRTHSHSPFCALACGACRFCTDDFYDVLKSREVSTVAASEQRAAMIHRQGSEWADC